MAARAARRFVPHPGAELSDRPIADPLLTGFANRRCYLVTQIRPLTYRSFASVHDHRASETAGAASVRGQPPLRRARAPRRARRRPRSASAECARRFSILRVQALCARPRSTQGKTASAHVASPTPALNSARTASCGASCYIERTWLSARDASTSTQPVVTTHRHATVRR